MPEERWERIKAAFEAVMAAPAHERGAAIERECAGDDELKREVESLVNVRTQAFVRTGGAAEAIGNATTTSAPIVEKPGEVIGHYKLLQAIGEGGFGTVFLAEQSEPVRRKVALKIIKLGMDTRAVVARFEAERQALAMMDHPHIARVLDGGATDSGRPYFVMEYVKGDAITAFADAHKLGVRERLDLFSQVCAAVQHAHTKGIIHRDLKPGNVLVSMTDGRPFAKVIDFGIAKATGASLTDKTLFTEHRQLIGTPEYMSPEQAEGSPDIDTRTDVYALGVLLYELLTGATPFDAKRLRSAAFAEMQRIIKEEEPLAPSVRVTQLLGTPHASVGADPSSPGVSASTPGADALPRLRVGLTVKHNEPLVDARVLKGELDWIVMKALDKDRARRYESPSQMAEDVRRHLGGEAVVAAPASVGYRVRKLVRRNRGKVVAGSAIAMALTLGVGVATFGLWEASQANRALTSQVTAARAALSKVVLEDLDRHQVTNHVHVEVMDDEGRSLGIVSAAPSKENPTGPRHVLGLLGPDKQPADGLQAIKMLGQVALENVRDLARANTALEDANASLTKANTRLRETLAFAQEHVGQLLIQQKALDSGAGDVEEFGISGGIGLKWTISERTDGAVIEFSPPPGMDENQLTRGLIYKLFISAFERFQAIEAANTQLREEVKRLRLAKADLVMQRILVRGEDWIMPPTVEQLRDAVSSRHEYLGPNDRATIVALFELGRVLAHPPHTAEGLPMLRQAIERAETSTEIAPLRYIEMLSVASGLHQESLEFEYAEIANWKIADALEKYARAVPDEHDIPMTIEVGPTVPDGWSDMTYKPAAEIFLDMAPQFRARTGDALRKSVARELSASTMMVLRGAKYGVELDALDVFHAVQAVKADPECGECALTLAMTNYRQSQYPEALAALAKASEISPKEGKGEHPATLAFTAMSQFKLNHPAEARAALARLRELIQDPKYKDDAEALGFLREAEELIEGNPADK